VSDTIAGAARRDVIVAGLLVGGVWTLGAALPVGFDEPGAIYVLSDYVYSSMLASFAVVGWLAISAAPRHRGVRLFGWTLAVAGVVGAVGNLLEDIVGVGGSEYLYGVGFFATILGFVGLAAALAVARRLVGAALVLATLVGTVVMAGHGPPVIPVLWLGAAACAFAVRTPTPRAAT
jgi:hypothetical protein